MRALTYQGKREVGWRPSRTRGSGPDGHHRQDHVHRHLRLRSSPVRGARALPRPRRHPRARAHGRGGGGRTRRHRRRPGDRVVIPSTCPAVTATCARRGCTPSARRPRCVSAAREPPSSGSPSSTGRCPEGRRSICGSRSATPCPSRSRTVRRTTGSSSCPTSCPPPGEPWSTRTSRPAAASPCSASARSAPWPPGSPSIRGAGLVIGVDLVPARLDRVSGYGATCLDLRRYGKNLGDAVRDLTDGRGTDAVIDAVGMEATARPWQARRTRRSGCCPTRSPSA